MRWLIFLLPLVFRTRCVFYTSSAPQFSPATFWGLSGYHAGLHRVRTLHSVLNRSSASWPPFHVPDLKGNNPEVLPEESGLMVFGRFSVTGLKFLFIPIFSGAFIVSGCEFYQCFFASKEIKNFFLMLLLGWILYYHVSLIFIIVDSGDKPEFTLLDAIGTIFVDLWVHVQQWVQPINVVSFCPCLVEVSIHQISFITFVKQYSQIFKYLYSLRIILKYVYMFTCVSVFIHICICPYVKDRLQILVCIKNYPILEGLEKSKR